MKEDIIRMAREAGIGPVYGNDSIERFAALVAAAECERIKQANAPEIERCNAYIKELEEAIRARRNTPASINPQPEPISVACRHQWVSTGAMNPGECRCIQCGTWGQVTRASASPHTPDVAAIRARGDV